MQTLRHDSIIRRLKKEGLRFSTFSLSSEGEYAAEDADWNYKDIPHLPVIHRLADSCPTVMADEVVCTINMQSILGIWFPIVVNVYEVEKNWLVYYTTLFFFVLVIDTRIEEPRPLHTIVKTTYNIGYPRWLFFVVPLLRWLVKRNYRVLMSEDIPMRTRRGELRKLGYGFHKKAETYGFLETVNIYNKNVLLPEGASRTHSANYRQNFGNAVECYVGDAGLLGLRLIREGDTVTVWPRTCPHEGAPLDRAPCKEGAVHCPWHGRRITPVGIFEWGQDGEFEKDDYRIQVQGEIMTWHYLGNAETSSCR